MSTDILGSVVRALATVPNGLLGMVKDFIHKITGSDADLWVAQGKLFLQQKPCWTEKQNGRVAVADPNILEVDYSITLEQMIGAGKYDWKNENITSSRFPVKDEGVVQFEFKLFHFNRTTTSEKVEKAIREEDETNSWEPAQIEHLLVFGAKLPEEQRKFPVIALGSSAQLVGRRDVPCLCGDDSRRNLGLAWWVAGWYGHCRFLAVRKFSVPQT